MVKETKIVAEPVAAVATEASMDTAVTVAEAAKTIATAAATVAAAAESVASSVSSSKEAKVANDKTALKAFTVVQQLDDVFWRWTREPSRRPSLEEWFLNDAGRIYEEQCAIRDELKAALASARAGDIAPLTVWVARRLAPCGIQEVHGIIHNKDKTFVWDKTAGENVQIDVTAHAHFLGRFAESRVYNANRTQKNIAEALGVVANSVKRPSKGRYAIDNMLAYLIHIKEDGKEEYPATAVYSYIPDGSNGECYLDIYRQQYDSWMSGRAIKMKRKSELTLEMLRSKILCGEMTEEQILETPELLEVYARHRKKIEDALELYGKKCSMIARKALENDKFRTVVFYVYGQSRTGKSHLALNFAKRMAAEGRSMPWQIMYLGGEHPVDRYRGEEILIGNDLELNAMPPGEWKRLLDNAVAEKQSARYDDVVVAPRVIVLSSTISPANFFKTFAKQGEEFNQFIGRISVVVEVAEGHVEDPRKTKFRIGCRKVVEKYKIDSNISCNYEFVYSKETFSCDEIFEKLKNVFDLYALPSAAFELPALPFTIDDVKDSVSLKT